MSVAQIATVPGVRPVVELGVGNTNTPTGQAVWDTAHWSGEEPPPAGTAVLSEPFNDYTTNGWVTVSSPPIVAGRTGNGANMSGSSDTATYTVPPASCSEWIVVGFAWKIDVFALTTPIVELLSDAAATLHSQLTTTNSGGVAGRITFTRGVTAIASTPAVPGPLVPGSVWQYIEVRSRLHDTAGSVEVRVNGTSVLSATGLDTKNAGTSTVYDSVRIKSGSGANAVFDDFYITTGADAVFKGDITIPAATGRAFIDTGDEWAGTEPTWLDITCDVHDVEIDQGRDRSISRWQVGTASVTLDNTTGRYDLAADPVSPAVLNVRPGRQVRAGVAIDDGEVTWLGRWFIDAATPTYDPVLQDVVTLACVDAKGQAGKVELGKVDPAVGGSETVTARINRVLDAAGWLAAYRDLQASSVTVQATALGAAAVDLIDVAADSAGGAVFGDTRGMVVYKNRDWQLYEPDVPVDGTIGNLPASDIVDGGDDVVWFGDQLVWGVGDWVCPSGWELTFDAADMATRVLVGRPSETPHQFDDATNQTLYGVETFTRNDLIPANVAELDVLGARILRVLSADFMPNVAAVTIDAGTSTGARDLAATVDPTLPSRYRGYLREGGRVVFDRQFLCVGVAHRIDPETWTVRIALDDAGPFAIAGNRWDDAAWSTGTWAEPAAALVVEARELIGALNG